MSRTFGSLLAATMQGNNPTGSIARPFLSSLQTVVKIEGGNKMVTNLKGIKSVTELNGDTITNVSSTRVLPSQCLRGVET